MLTLLITALIVMAICTIILIIHSLTNKNIFHESFTTAAALAMIIASICMWIGLIGVIVNIYNATVVDKKVASYEVNMKEVNYGRHKKEMESYFV